MIPPLPMSLTELRAIVATLFSSVKEKINYFVKKYLQQNQ
jgi:hypothetical protein